MLCFFLYEEKKHKKIKACRQSDQKEPRSLLLEFFKIVIVKSLLMHTNPEKVLSQNILFSYGSYYTSPVRVLVWPSEAATEICCKKIVLVSIKKNLKKYLLKNFIFSKVTDCMHVTWLKINFFKGFFYCVAGVTGQPQLTSL